MTLNPGKLHASEAGTCLLGFRSRSQAGLADCPPQAGADRLRPLFSLIGE